LRERDIENGSEIFKEMSSIDGEAECEADGRSASSSGEDRDAPRPLPAAESGDDAHPPFSISGVTSESAAEAVAPAHEREPSISAPPFEAAISTEAVATARDGSGSTCSSSSNVVVKIGMVGDAQVASDLLSRYVNIACLISMLCS
jgi:hypothetical protein